MPLLSAQNVLNACADVLRQSSRDEANQRIQEILSEQYGVAPVLLSMLDFSTFMAEIDYPVGSVFHLRANCTPEEEIAIRILLQIVRQRSYNILLETDLAEIERSEETSLKEHRASRISLKLRDAIGLVDGIMQEECDDFDSFLDLNQKLRKLSENVTQDVINDLINKSLPDLLRRYTAGTSPAIHRNLSDLMVVLTNVYNITGEHSVIMGLATTYSENLLDKQREAALSLRKIFCSIPALSRVSGYFWDSIERPNEFSEQGKFLYALSQNEVVDPDTLYDGMTTRPYQSMLDAAIFVNSYAPAAKMTPSIIELIASFNIKGVRPIRGDGNCYYRAAIVGLLEKLVFCSENERQVRFTYLATQFQQLVNDEILTPDSIPAVKLVINVLNDAAAGRALLTIHDVEQFLLAHDLTLVAAMRSALTNSLVNKLGEEYQGMTLESVIVSSPEYGNVGDYVKILMKMGECAQGPAVNACLLNTFLGANLHVSLLGRPECTIIDNPENVLDVNGYRPLDVHLLLRPGHYDLLETQETYDNLRRAEKLAFRAPSLAQVRVPAAPNSVLPPPEQVEIGYVPPEQVEIGYVPPEPANSVLPRPEQVQIEYVPPASFYPNDYFLDENILWHRGEVRPSSSKMVDSKPLMTPQENSNLMGENTDKKPNYSFIFSVFATPKVSLILATVLLLSACALIGVASFGVIPLAVGVAVGASSFVASLGMFGLGRTRLTKESELESKPQIGKDV